MEYGLEWRSAFKEILIKVASRMYTEIHGSEPMPDTGYFEIIIGIVKEDLKMAMVNDKNNAAD